MHRCDHNWKGFSWLDCSDFNASVYSFMRRADACKPVLWVFNFTPVVRENYRIPCPDGGMWKEALNTDSQFYGGGNVGNPFVLRAEHSGWGDAPSLALTLPPLAGMAFLPVDEESD
jgi:1,4-alpha-glucan branching enzyme